jgi:hypothetical protein
MANESNKRLLQIAVLVVPIVAAAAGGKWAVDATRLPAMPSASLPTATELDSLRGYVTRKAPPQAPAKLELSSYAIGGSDPFGKVARSETPRYSADLGAQVRPPARWIVSTIMITDNRRVAVINGVLASPSTILPGGARVLAIEPDHVVIAESNGARREISVQNGAN